jgi:hypothetical protein
MNEGDRRAVVSSGRQWRGRRSEGARAMELTDGSRGEKGDCGDIVWGLTEDGEQLGSNAMQAVLGGRKWMA